MTTLTSKKVEMMGYGGIAQNPLNRARAMCAAAAAVMDDAEGRTPSTAMDALMNAVGFTVRARAVSSAEILAGDGLSLRTKDHLDMLSLPDGSAVGATKGRWTAVVKWVEAWGEEYLTKK